MENNEMKKLLYKYKPIAKLSFIRKGVAYYSVHIKQLLQDAFFEIPVSDMGDADFYTEMDAKLLIRWLK